MAATPLRLVNRILESNSYVVEDGEGGCLVIDPGLDPEPLCEALEQAELTPRAVLCTHGHFDHIGGAAHLQARFTVPVRLHRGDQKTVRSANFMMMAFNMTERVTLPEFEWVDDGATFRAGALEGRFQAAPGHTPGSCLIHCGPWVFTGDTLYARGVGLVKLPGEDPERLRQTLRQLWDTLDEAVEVLPGHGGTSTFSDVKQENLPLRRFLDEPVPAVESQP